MAKLPELLLAFFEMIASLERWLRKTPQDAIEDGQKTEADAEEHQKKTGRPTWDD